MRGKAHEAFGLVHATYGKMAARNGCKMCEKRWFFCEIFLGRVDKILGEDPKIYPLGNLGPH